MTLPFITMASLVAIAYIGSHPYLGLGIALLGGIAFGVAAFLSYEAEQCEKQDR